MFENITWVDVLTLLVIASALGVAIRGLFLAKKAGRTALEHLKAYERQLRQDTFSKLLQDISGEQQSKDRGYTRSYLRDANDDERLKAIKSAVDLVRKDLPNNTKGLNQELLAYGRAIERTIASFDRMAFFLLQAKEDNPERELVMTPPIWLIAMYMEFWNYLRGWVKYRQGGSVDNPHAQEGYGWYFEEMSLKEINQD